MCKCLRTAHAEESEKVRSTIVVAGNCFVLCGGRKLERDLMNTT